MLYFVVIHILPSCSTYITIFSLGNGTGRTPPLFDPAVLLSSLSVTVDHLGLFIDLLALLALIVLLRKPSLSDKQVILIFVVLVLGFSTIIKGKPIFYTILVYPAAALLVTALLERVLSQPWKGSLFASARLAAYMDCSLSRSFCRWSFWFNSMHLTITRLP